FGVAEPSKAARQRHQKERDGDGRASRWAAMHQDLRRAASAQEVHDDIEDLSVEDGRCLEVFSGGCRPGKHEDARSDYGTNTQRGQRPGAKRLLQALAGCFGFRDQLVDGLAAEKLVVGCTNNLSGFRSWL